VKVIALGVCKSGLKVSCFVVVSMWNGHFGNSLMLGVVRVDMFGKFLCYV
jgi:hypothetical protein